MLQASTVLVEHTPRQVNKRDGSGSFIVHKFKDQAGTVFETTKQDVANLAYGLLNQPVTITYDAVQNGDFVNNKIQAVAAGATVGAPAAAAAPTASSAPTATAAPTQASSSGGDQSDFRRSKEEMRRVEALTGAIKVVESGLVEVSNITELFTLADFVGEYLEAGTKAAPPAAGGESATPVAATAAPAGAPDGDIPF